jgi:hypothetical protein
MVGTSPLLRNRCRFDAETHSDSVLGLTARDGWMSGANAFGLLLGGVTTLDDDGRAYYVDLFLGSPPIRHF